MGHYSTFEVERLRVKVVASRVLGRSGQINPINAHLPYIITFLTRVNAQLNAAQTEQ